MTRATASLLVGGIALSLAAAPSGASDPPTGLRPPTERAAPAPERRLVVTFWDRPGPAEAAVRLEGAGRVRALAPEAGVWSLEALPGLALAGVLGRPRVRSAEWPLARPASVRRVRSAALAPAEGAPALASAAATAAGPFRDPIYAAGLQWGLAREGWTPALTALAVRPTIAILDSGLDLRHPEWSGPASPIVFAHSVLRNDANASDWSGDGHGTHVAGIAAAPANGLGIVGVAPAAASTAQLMPVQVSERSGLSSDEELIAGIRWAVLHGARVINISSGGPGYLQAVQDTVDWAFARGALIVAAVGNDGRAKGSDPVSYPAGYAHVLGVGAQCDGDVAPDCPDAYGPATFTSHNASLDVIAPGVDVISTVPARVRERAVAPGYALMDGTSMAAPYVAGVAALVFAAHPEASPSQVLRQIENTATPVGPAGWNNRSGHGSVDPVAAVSAPLPPDDPGEPNDDVPPLAGIARLAGSGTQTTIQASVSRRDDPVDVYPLSLRRGETVTASLACGERRSLTLSLWRPGTTTVWSWNPANERNVLRYARPDGPGRQTLVVRAPLGGRYLLKVAAKDDGGPYLLTVSPAPATGPTQVRTAADPSAPVIAVRGRRAAAGRDPGR